MNDSDILESALRKFLSWYKEYEEVTAEHPRDGAEQLGIQLYGRDIPTKLIGGCNAKIFHDATARIERLNGEITHLRDTLHTIADLAGGQVIGPLPDRCAAIASLVQVTLRGEDANSPGG